jgi:hypothetical protein
MMTRLSPWWLVLLSVLALPGCTRKVQANVQPRNTFHQQLFDQLLAQYPNLTYHQLSDLTPQRTYLEQLSFDPAQAKFYDQAIKGLQLTESEQEMLRHQGLVSVDHGRLSSFGSAYLAIYSQDLPVLVTSDSILHAMHRSYDDILMELEQKFFIEALDEILSKCHNQLTLSAPNSAAAENFQDVDVYLTVARNLLQGAGGPAKAESQPEDVWSGNLLVASKLGQDDSVKTILGFVQSHILQDPNKGQGTLLFGGLRAIDYSQFQPRGHYLKTAQLCRYFRTMMWLGRADTGCIILPPDPQSGIASNSSRELRDAVLLTQLLQSTGEIDRLQQVSDILDFLVGRSDNLSAPQLANLMQRQKIDSVDDLADEARVTALQNALRTGDLGQQQIRSQVVLSNPDDLHQVPPHSIFQLFGQHFVIDSFVLSNVVYDSIIFEGQKVERQMPTGLDVMFALGNNAALPLLDQELVKFPYAANLKASQDYVAHYQPAFWQENLYNIWLDSLRTLQADLTAEKNLPEAMRTKAWQRKQLQTGLASWAELRHDTILYAKQSYTAEIKCEYPMGYVEPYAETFARIKLFADEAARRIAAADFKLANVDHSDIQQHEVDFFKQMTKTLEKLELLARKELASEPFTDAEQQWLKKLIAEEPSNMCGSPPTYSGWYCKLFYGGGSQSAEWDPTVSDVHTDPNTQTVLEEGVGDCTFLVAAVNNGDDKMIYVGPAFTYYEFSQRAEDRLTDEKWKETLISRKQPPRPSWISDFQPTKSDPPATR